MLGVFNPSGPCNQSNVGDLALLLRNLNEFMVDEGDDSYVCRFCFRSLYPRKTRRERILCACLRCVSVLYCSPACRDDDARGHRFSGFLHPAWECEESTRRREQELSAAGISAKPSEEQKIPVIEAMPDLRADPQAPFDAAAQLLDDIDIVADDDDDAGRTAKAPRDEAEGQVATKTADEGGNTDVDTQA